MEIKTEEGRKRKEEKRKYYLMNKERIRQRDFTNKCLGCSKLIHYSAERCHSCNMKGERNVMHGMNLEKAPSWKGGTSFGEYDFVFSKKLKNELKNKASYTCTECNLQILRGNRNIKLAIHHKDFNKHNNDLSNLQVVCSNCHAKIHYNQRGKHSNGQLK